MTPDFRDRQSDPADDERGPHDRDRATDAEAVELGEAAAALRNRIGAPELYPHPFPQEVTLHMVAHLLETIADAEPMPTRDRWRSTVEAALEIARHVHRNSSSS